MTDHAPQWILNAIVAVVNTVATAVAHWSDLVPFAWVAAGYGYSWAWAVMASWGWIDARRERRAAAEVSQ